MNIRIYNARLLTMEENGQAAPALITGEIQVQGDSILYSGPSPHPADITWDREIDADGNLLLPGFKDAHTHSGMTFLRSFADDLPLQEWLFNKIFPMEDELSDEDVYWCSRLAILEYLTSGITANFDMYKKISSIAKASVDSGFRTVLCGSINDYGGTVEDMEQEYNEYNHYDDLISYQFGFHAEYTTSRDILEGMASLSQKYKAPVYTHNSETKAEVDECVGRYGTTPTAFLDSLGMFEYGGGGFHCVHMTEEDLDICLQKKIWVVTNPASNVKLASGIAPLVRMTEKGIGLAIGTDGPSSNNCLDMFREMFLATSLQKVSIPDAAAMDADIVLKMATTGGAGAMCLTDCDTLAAGKKADLVMIDLHQPNMQPYNNITKNIVYSGSKQNVKMTMVNGKILYENGKFYVGAEPEEIYARVNETITRIKKVKSSANA